MDKGNSWQRIQTINKCNLFNMTSCVFLWLFSSAVSFYHWPLVILIKIRVFFCALNYLVGIPDHMWRILKVVTAEEDVQSICQGNREIYQISWDQILQSTFSMDRLFIFQFIIMWGGNYQMPCINQDASKNIDPSPEYRIYPPWNWNHVMLTIN